MLVVEFDKEAGSRKQSSATVMKKLKGATF